MVHQLPADLRVRIEQAVLGNGQAASEIRDAARSLSARYRRELGGNLQISGRDEALAYLAVRLPATFAVNVRALEETFRLAGPDFRPSSVLDAGAGPATASYAASHIADIGDYCLVEPNPHLRAAGEEFITPDIAGHREWQAASLKEFRTGRTFDLVLASYVLNELTETERTKTISKLWSLCGGVLVIVETGTPLGFSVIDLARDMARNTPDCHILGPCPQQSRSCPLSSQPDRWCHFSVRVERSRLHKAMKQGATLGYEDEKFSWIALSRFEKKRPAYRLIGHAVGTRCRSLQVCDRTGQAQTLEIAKSSPYYKAVRKLDWGDCLDEL